MLGQISLNLSFFIYIILYLPQIIHNQKQANLDGLSTCMHMILYCAYSLDVLYGFTIELPWQYRAVSSVGWFLLNIQHLQLAHHFKQKKKYTITHGYSGLLLTSISLVFYGIQCQPFSEQSIDLFGYVAQLGFIGATIPQIIKTKQIKSAQAINLHYVLFNVLLSLLDLISAWKLEWGWPNKVGSAILLSFMCILLLQNYHYTRLTKKQMTHPYRSNYPSQIS